MNESNEHVGQYGEPWQVKRAHVAATGRYRCMFSPLNLDVPDAMSLDVAERIVTCVNALAGIPDVSAFVRKYGEMREALEAAHCLISDYWSELGGGTNLDVVEVDDAIEAALNLTEGK